jgi:Spy/CpxP family protein refolding chaperone
MISSGFEQVGTAFAVEEVNFDVHLFQPEEAIMKLNRYVKFIIFATILGIVALAANAFAGWGRGNGRGFGPGDGYGQHGYNCPAAFEKLSDEQIDRLNQMRTQYFDDTRDLRQQIHQKRLELWRELAKENPDKTRALDLQKAVSGLRGEMDQKRLEQRLELKKEFPELVENGFGRGDGKGRGWGMRQGGPGRGYGMRQGPPNFGRGSGRGY